MPAWERNWVENHQDTDYEWGTIDVVDFSKKMIALSKDISEKELKLNQPNLIGVWSLGDKETKEVKLNLSAHMLEKMKGISIEIIKGRKEIEATGFTLEADGKLLASSDDVKSLQEKTTYPIVLPEKIQANNGCVLTVRFTSSSGKAAGVILLE